MATVPEEDEADLYNTLINFDNFISASYQPTDIFHLSTFDIKTLDPNEGHTLNKIVVTGKYNVNPRGTYSYFQKLNGIEPQENIVHCWSLGPTVNIRLRLPSSMLAEISKDDLLESWLHLRHSDPVSEGWVQLQTMFVKMQDYKYNLDDWVCKYVNSQFLSNPVHIRKIQRTQLVMAQGLIDGVTYLHSKGILHGALHPTNIVFSPHDDFALPLKITRHPFTAYTTPIPEPDLPPSTEQDDIHGVGDLLKRILVAIVEDEATGTLSNDWDRKTKGHPIIENYHELISKATEGSRAERFQSMDEMTLKFRDSHKGDDQNLLPNSVLKLLTIIQDQTKYDWLQNLTFIGELGHGSFGFVAKAEDIYHNETAVKIFKQSQIMPKSSFGSITTDEAIVEDPAGEYENMKEVYHRNLVNQFQHRTVRLELKNFEEKFREVRSLMDKLGPWNDFISFQVIEMELCGSTLESWIGKPSDLVEKVDPLPMFQFRVILGLIEGLNFLHERKIIHDDLAPRNIFFRKGFELPVKIGDFGLSVLSKGNSPENMSVKPNRNKIYAAPETYSTTNQSYDGKLADIYSLGLIIWQVSDPKNVRLNHFERLVHDGEEDLVHEHSFIVKLREYIIEMTKMDPKARLQNLTDVKLNVSHQDRNAPIIIESSNSEEFQLVLNHCLEDARIQLSNGIYNGPFISRTKGVQIIGSAGTILETMEGPTTCLQLFGENSSVESLAINCDSNVAISLDLNRNGCVGKNLCINGGVRSVNVNADSCTLERFTILPAEHGILVQGSNNTFKRIHIANCSSAVIVHKYKNTEVEEETSNNCFEELSTEGCLIGMEIDGNGTTVIESVFKPGDFKWKMNWKLDADDEDEVTEEDFGPKCGIILRSSDTVLQNIQCLGYSSERNECSIKIEILSESVMSLNLRNLFL